MFTKYANEQFAAYHKSIDYFKAHPERLIEAEHFVMKEILHFIDIHLPEIRRDYDEASYLYSFWRNYPPEDRGRKPKGDQYPWIEVGEQVFGNKLARHFNANFSVKDSGLPSGSDDRCVISSPRIGEILGITDSVWVFIDIKSEGPRDSADHSVMSTNQVSGSGDWKNVEDGKTIGQPLERIKIASIPNGILLTQKPNYTKKYPRLFFPGKDDSTTNPRKARDRVSFELLREIAPWRVNEITLQNK